MFRELLIANTTFRKRVCHTSNACAFLPSHLVFLVAGLTPFLLGCCLLVGVAWVVYYDRLIFYPRPLSWGEVALETVGYYTRKKVSDRMLSWMAPVFPAPNMQMPALEYYVR